MADPLPQAAPELATVVAQLAQEQAKRKWAEMRVTQLEELVRLLRLKKYGPQGENLAAFYLPLFDEEPGVSLDEVAAEAAAPICRRSHCANGRSIPAASRCPPTCGGPQKLDTKMVIA